MELTFFKHKMAKNGVFERTEHGGIGKKINFGQNSLSKTLQNVVQNQFWRANAHAKPFLPNSAQNFATFTFLEF